MADGITIVVVDTMVQDLFSRLLARTRDLSGLMADIGV